MFRRFIALLPTFWVPTKKIFYAPETLWKHENINNKAEAHIAAKDDEHTVFYFGL